jgi:hypothetical protein
MRFILVLWLLFITALSLVPLEVKYRLGTMGSMHSFGHLAIFVVTAVLMCWNAGSVSARLLRCCGALLVAMLLEALEKVVYHNAYEWSDVAIDAAGVLIGFVLVTFISMSAPASSRS